MKEAEDRHTNTWSMCRVEGNIMLITDFSQTAQDYAIVIAANSFKTSLPHLFVFVFFLVSFHVWMFI